VRITTEIMKKYGGKLFIIQAASSVSDEVIIRTNINYTL